VEVAEVVVARISLASMELQASSYTPLDLAAVMTGLVTERRPHVEIALL
jgi:hypothetical protein